VSHALFPSPPPASLPYQQAVEFVFLSFCPVLLCSFSVEPTLLESLFTLLLDEKLVRQMLDD
jgi:hypothetical protein